MSNIERQKRCHDDDLDSDSNISVKLMKSEDYDKSFSEINISAKPMKSNDHDKSSAVAVVTQTAILTEKLLTNSTQKRSNHERERHAELFRKDLISAMKLADTEMLQPEEYFQIVDQWKLEWERGVQVPINPDAILPVVVSIKIENENLYGPTAFKIPKKYLHASQDEAYKPVIHELQETQKLTELVCRYDLDDQDTVWLQNYNQLRDEMGDDPITELTMEKIIEELETRCYSKLQQAQKTVEGLGIEYDENVVCDVCRSPDGEDCNEMVFCDSCDICVHQACYGIQMIPEGNWLCRTCALGIQPQCVLCPQSGGALKSTKNGNDWAHISCALWIPEVSILCPDRMEPITNIVQIPASRWALVCTLCKERVGACIQCSVKACKTSFHVTCAFKNNLELKTTFDETTEDVQLKAYCPKHSGQKAENIDEDGCLLSPSKPLIKPELTEEEKTELRSHRLKKLEEEFYNYVGAKEVSDALQVDEEAVDFFHSYWVIKRKSQFNRPLLTPKLEEGDILLKQREDGLIARMKMFIHLRQDLERVRNLCYMVNKREKSRRQLYRMKEEIFNHQAKIAEEEEEEGGVGAVTTTTTDDIVVNGHRMTNTIYDHPEGILREARSMEEKDRILDMDDSLVSAKETMKNSENERRSAAIRHRAMTTTTTGESDKMSNPSNVKRERKDGASRGGGSFAVKMEADVGNRVEVKKETKEDVVVKSDKVLNDDVARLTRDGKSDDGNYSKDIERTLEKDRNKETAFSVVAGAFDGNARTASSAVAETIRWEKIDSTAATVTEVRVAKKENNRNRVRFKSDRKKNNVDIGSILASKTSDDVGVVYGHLTLTDQESKESDGRRMDFPISSRTTMASDDSGQGLGIVGSSKLSKLSKGQILMRGKRRNRSDVKTETLPLPSPPPPPCLSLLMKDAEASVVDDRDLSSFLQENLRVTTDEEDLKKEEETVGGGDEPHTKPDGIGIRENDNNPLLDDAGENRLVGDDFLAGRQRPEETNRSIEATKPSDPNGNNLRKPLRQFTLDELVISKEIKQRVEKCLLKLPPSFNGLCKHLQQQLAACNLYYNSNGEKRAQTTKEVVSNGGAAESPARDKLQASDVVRRSPHRTGLFTSDVFPADIVALNDTETRREKPKIAKTWANDLVERESAKRRCPTANRKRRTNGKMNGRKDLVFGLPTTVRAPVGPVQVIVVDDDDDDEEELAMVEDDDDDFEPSDWSDESCSIDSLTDDYLDDLDTNASLSNGSKIKR